MSRICFMDADREQVAACQKNSTIFLRLSFLRKTDCSAVFTPCCLKTWFDGSVPIRIIFSTDGLLIAIYYDLILAHVDAVWRSYPATGFNCEGSIVKIGVLLDDRVVSSWQAESLQRLIGNNEFFLYNCTTRPARHIRLRHYPYYLWRQFAFRNKLTRPVSFPSSLNVVGEINFESEQDGIWQKIPAALIDRIAQDNPALLIKFGMGLLRIPPTASLDCPILSYHHGDPREFRGRPAGFYEMLSGKATIGQIVQILSDRLDAGPVIAFAETKVHHHSYRATMSEAYRCSPLLLAQAINNLQAGEVLPIAPTGPNYRLPGTAMVLRMMVRSLASLFCRIRYGAFFQKEWRVAHIEEGSATLPSLASSFPSETRWKHIENPHTYRFLADPFFHPAGSGFLVEALRASDGLGEILHIDSDRSATAIGNRGHFSYPGSFSSGVNEYVLPEIAGWSSPRIFRWSNPQFEDAGVLDIKGSPRILDPTMLVENDKYYLFGNLASEGGGILRLWSAEHLSAEFCEHPRSPVRISPTGSRMGGMICALGDTRFRVGQDLRGAYGDGVILFEITELSDLCYRETQVGTLRFDGHKGPHTLNIKSDRVLFDYYDDTFSWFAGLRRARSYIGNRSFRKMLKNEPAQR